VEKGLMVGRNSFIISQPTEIFGKYIPIPGARRLRIAVFVKEMRIDRLWLQKIKLFAKAPDIPESLALGLTTASQYRLILRSLFAEYPSC